MAFAVIGLAGLLLAMASRAELDADTTWTIHGTNNASLHQALLKAADEASIAVSSGGDTQGSLTCDKALSTRRLLLLGVAATARAMACLDAADPAKLTAAIWVVADIPLAAWYRLAPKQFPGQVRVIVQAIDQPLERQLALAERLFPGPETVAVLSSQTMAPWSQVNAAFLRDSPHRVQTVFLRNDELAPMFIAAARRHDLLVLPIEPSLFNAATARTLLLSAYRQRRPLVGNTQAFVRAGVLASCVTSDAIQVSDIVSILLNPPAGTTPILRMPSDFEVVINEQVALAYGIGRKDPFVLKRAIKLRLGGRQNP
jgi:hypothetical protein